LDHQIKFIYFTSDSGSRRFFLSFLFFLMTTCYLLIPSSLLAVNRDESFEQVSSQISSIDQVKSEFFQNKLDKYIGIPYIRGGVTEKGFDCSGFVRQVYMEFFGVDLPHKSSSQSSFPSMQKVTKDELLTGDLVFFSPSSKKKRINHVGIYLSDGRFIHAAKGGVTISSLDNTYWKARFYMAKRIGNNDIWNSIETKEPAETELLSLYNKYSSQFNLLTDMNGNFSLSDAYPSYEEQSNDTLSLGYEVTWSASMANGSFIPKVTAFQKYYHPFQSDQIKSLSILENNEYDEYNLISMSDRSSDQGMNFAAAFGSADNGLSLMPSFTYSDSGYNLEKRRLQRFTYGLDFEISPSDRPWFLALGMQFSDYTYSHNSKSIETMNEFRSPLNMSFTYLHKLNKSAYLSFTGELVQRLDQASQGGAFDQWKDERRSLFLFNYKY
jgi:hypothetical protein